MSTPTRDDLTICRSDTIRRLTFAPANCVVFQKFSRSDSVKFLFGRTFSMNVSTPTEGEMLWFLLSDAGSRPLWFRAAMLSYFDGEFSEAFLAHYDVINIRRAYDYGYISCAALIIRSLRRREIFTQEIRWIRCLCSWNRKWHCRENIRLHWFAGKKNK